MNFEQCLLAWIEIGVVSVVGGAAMLSARRRPDLRVAFARLTILAATTILILVQYQPPRAESPVQISTATTIAPIVTQFQKVTLSSAQPSVEPSAEEAEPSKPSMSIQDVYAVWSQASGRIWLFGLLSGGLYLLFGHLAIFRLTARYQGSVSPSTSELASALARQLNISSPRIRELSTIKSPFVAGSVRSILFVPTDWPADFDDESKRSVLLHELAHLLHGDLRWNAIQRWLSLLLWVQPLFWLAMKCQSQAQEELCDLMVVRSGVPEGNYADLLLKLRGAIAGTKQPGFAIGVVKLRSRLGRRIESLIRGGANRPVRVDHRTRWLIRIATLSVLGVAAFVFGRPPISGLIPSEVLPIQGSYPTTLAVYGANGDKVSKGVAWLSVSGDRSKAQEIPLRWDAHGVNVPEIPSTTDTAGTVILQGEDGSLGVVRIWPAKQPVTRYRFEPLAAVTGEVRLPNHTPAAHALVKIRSIVRRENAHNFTFAMLEKLKLSHTSTQCDANGRFVFYGCPAGFQVALTASLNTLRAGPVSAQKPLSALELNRLEPLQLWQTATISGRVTRNGLPAVGIRVGAQSEMVEGGEGTTDQDGRYTISGLKSVPYSVALDITKETAVAHANVAPRPGDQMTGVDFDIIPGCKLSGRVVDSDGLPVKHAYVGVYGPAHPQATAWVNMVWTDEQGRYLLIVPPGKQYVYVGDGRYSSDPQTPDIDQDTALPDLVVRPAQGASIQEGTPIYQFDSTQLQTGAVASTDLPNGDRYEVSLISDGVRAWLPGGGITKADLTPLRTHLPATRREHVLFVRIRQSGTRQVDWNSRVFSFAHPSSKPEVLDIESPKSRQVWVRCTASEPKLRTDIRIGDVLSDAENTDVSNNARIVSRGTGVEVRVPISLSVEGRKLSLRVKALGVWRSPIDGDSQTKLDPQTGRPFRAFIFNNLRPGQIERVVLSAAEYHWTMLKGIHLNPGD